MAAVEQHPHSPHRSPKGTYECILTSVLEEPSLTNAEFRLFCSRCGQRLVPAGQAAG